MKKHPRIAVRAIITDDEGKILILRRDHTKYCEGMWNLPGGKVEYNETAEAALIAEVKEETGLEVTDTTWLMYLDNLPEEPGLPHYVTLVFSCNAHGTVKLSDESSDHRWIGEKETGHYQMAFGNDKVIQKYRELKKAPTELPFRK